MDQAQGLRELKSKRSSTKTVDVWLTKKEDASIIEAISEALDGYGFQSVIVATSKAKELFRQKIQDQLFDYGTVRTVSSSNVQMIFYVRTINDEKVDQQQRPLFLFVHPDKQALMQTYQVVKNERHQLVYLIGTGSTDLVELQMGIANMESTIQRFLAKQTNVLGVIPTAPNEDYIDSIYESTGLFVRQVLMS